MLVLSNGLVVDITADRARYNALRREIFPDDSHVSLYGVIDVIYLNSPGYKDGPLFDFYFSGYTIADVDRADGWSEHDYQKFYRWLLEPEQVSRIELARLRFTDDLNVVTVRDDFAPYHLYSSLLYKINQLTLARATVSQWKSTLTNLMRSGVKEEELIWSGVLDRLSLSGGDEVFLTKEQILGWVDFSPVRVAMSSEVISEFDGLVDFVEVARLLPTAEVKVPAGLLSDDVQFLVRYISERYQYRIGFIRFLKHPYSLSHPWFLLDVSGNLIPNSVDGALFYNDLESAKKMAGRHVYSVLGIPPKKRFLNRYGYLTLHGGSDLREWVVTLPDYPRSFFGAHYSDRNVLVHIRASTRMSLSGRRLLFIEEVQSDWHQAGHQSGYENNGWGKVPNAPFKKEWPLLAMKLMLIRASKEAYDGVAWSYGGIHERRYTKGLPSVTRTYDQYIPQALNKIGKSFGLAVTEAVIKTREPWLTVVKKKNAWMVEGGEGRFSTRARFTEGEATEIAARHSRKLELSVPVFYINDSFRGEMSDFGLPLFGVTVPRL